MCNQSNPKPLFKHPSIQARSAPFPRACLYGGSTVCCVNNAVFKNLHLRKEDSTDDGCFDGLLY